MAREIVLIGRSNVGKSTLFRELTGRRVRVGRRPGITLQPYSVMAGDLLYVDMPGYGFMLGASGAEQERTRGSIIGYLEAHSARILSAVQVIDSAGFLDISDRCQRRGEVPIEVKLWDLLEDLGVDPILAANKMDRIAKHEWDLALDMICDRLGMPPPWRQWIDRVAPISAKRGEIEPLRRLIRERAADSS